uniref:Predicted protein n=1 Tax=Hordeum vulgare subsp. vulgare TaxID=112509 RepID=F2DV84_HORVV|nr:predicted protein [Hordeum vulgare subsp. vulgare]
MFWDAEAGGDPSLKKNVLGCKLKMQCNEHLFSESCADYFSCSVHICELLCPVLIFISFRKELIHVPLIGKLTRSTPRHGLLKGMLERLFAEKQSD